MSVTYRQILTITSFLTFHDGAMDVGDRDVGGRSIALELGNDGTDVLTNVRNGFMRASR
jgi:hypothetical protein